MTRRRGTLAAMRSVVIFAFLGASPAAAVDLSGVYVSKLSLFFPFEIPCTLTFVQTGTSLAIDGPCISGSTYTFDLDGTVDEITGAFSLTGVVLGLCGTPGSVTMSGTGDGEIFSATATCGPASSPVSGTKCDNGTLDSTETCEDGNTTGGDCCSAVCQVEPAGSPCAADSDSCTLDQCDGAGECEHPTAPSGAPCASDANSCTDDLCDAAGECTHVPTAGTCDDENACTTADFCSAGTCTGGPIAPECVGPLDMNGSWEMRTLTQTSAGVGVRNFVQTGGVLELISAAGVEDGIGSVNPATGVFSTERHFIAITPIFQFPCVETFNGTASADGMTFEGNALINCGGFGTFPAQATGTRCPGECLCPTIMECTSAAVGSKLTIRAGAGDATARWRWTHGALPASFGDPQVDTEYSICLETAGGGWVEVAPQGENWRSRGFGYLFTASDGAVKRLTLRESAQKTSVSAVVEFGAAPSLPLSTPARVRLIQTTGNVTSCFEAAFDAATVNTSSRFRARQ